IGAGPRRTRKDGSSSSFQRFESISRNMIPQAMEILGGLFGLSELLLALVKRSGKGSVSKDRGSLWMLWAVFFVIDDLATASTFPLPRPDGGPIPPHICNKRELLL